MESAGPLHAIRKTFIQKEVNNMGFYEPIITLKKGALSLLCFGVPGIIAAVFNFYPAISSVTVGTLATMFINYLKNR